MTQKYYSSPRESDENSNEEIERREERKGKRSRFCYSSKSE